MNHSHFGRDPTQSEYVYPEGAVCEVNRTALETHYKMPTKRIPAPVQPEYSIVSIQAKLDKATTVGELVSALREGCRFSDINPETYDKIIRASRSSEPLP